VDVDCKYKSDTGNNRGDWNHLKIEWMWTVHTKVIPVIIGVTGTISSLRQYLSNIPGKRKIKELQKTAILGTAHCGMC
jgi:hypothetical protein